MTLSKESRDAAELAARDTPEEGDIWQKSSDEWYIYLDGKWVLMSTDMQLERSK